MCGGGTGGATMGIKKGFWKSNFAGIKDRDRPCYLDHWYQYVMSSELLVGADPSSLSLFLTDYSMDCCSPTNFSSKVWERPTEIPLQKFIQTFPFIRNINCTGKVVGSWVARQKPSSLFFTWNFIVETKSLEIKIVWDEQSFSPDNWY